ncbi:iron-containing redox enzyme family protein [Prodigiosinella aquatilis]|nr:iron-containing redox enzyme family protein [Prodigiosinella sp. LS101]WJV53959.1 iron-containing redox enzyme family protein [Prodigiosinella sp. LS101]WJV58321.1 iron-containing redox enzyme family protein [Pectobacteriaceae bacterium C111]
MGFYQQLQTSTASSQQKMMSAPVIEACRYGNITREMYIAFLTQAYHHVSHTVPLLMAAGSRLPMSYEWVLSAIAEYIDEEYGHQEWILDDIQACGGDAQAVRHGHPHLSIELMLSFLYDRINRGNPMSIFGMIHVLEGTSVNIATSVAEQLEQGLKLPASAMSYLRSHGSLDQEHLKFFASLMDKVSEPHDQEAIVHSAHVVYQLYGDMLRSLTER